MALSQAVTARPGTPADCEQRQAIALHQRRLIKLGRETMLGPITRHKAGRSRYRMSQPEPLVRRFNITPLLRNRQANAPVISEFKSNEMTRQSNLNACLWRIFVRRTAGSRIVLAMTGQSANWNRPQTAAVQWSNSAKE